MVEAIDLLKSYGGPPVVNRVTIKVKEGQLVTLLGPSGCGKTSILRMIAGLVEPDDGEIAIGGTLVWSRSRRVNIAPEKRNIGMVFQSYAVWPHYTVFENVAYPLKVRKLSRTKIKEKVEHVLALLKMEHLVHRYPGELSGGQQQRVALARAIVYSPRVLLLDEPLANLDARVRETVRFEIKELQRKTKVTTIYVTHDQSEAMALSDKIIVIDNGVVVQEGTPGEIYSNPRSKFVASFVGTSNLIPATVSAIEQEHLVVKTEDGTDVRCRVFLDDQWSPGKRVLLCVRPEDFELHVLRPNIPVNTWNAKIEKFAFMGNIAIYWISLFGRTIQVQGHPHFEEMRNADEIFVTVREEKVRALANADHLEPLSNTTRTLHA